MARFLREKTRTRNCVLVIFPLDRSNPIEPRFQQLAATITPERILPAILEIVDIAGLVAGSAPMKALATNGDINAIVDKKIKPVMEMQFKMTINWADVRNRRGR